MTVQRYPQTEENLQNFESFLSTIELLDLREEYRHIKTVELDMPKNVQALDCIYREYWNKKSDWPDYHSFYEIYRDDKFNELESWWRSTGFSEETFYRGLPARIYRTWASLLTQIQGAYVAETIYGLNSVTMGVDADHSGKDIIIDFGQQFGQNFGKLPLQIKKISYRPEAQRGSPGQLVRDFVKVEYAVPNSGPLTSTGKPSRGYARWVEKWGDYLKRLENGFIVFKPAMFEARNLLTGFDRE